MRFPLCVSLLEVRVSDTHQSGCLRHCVGSLLCAPSSVLLSRTQPGASPTSLLPPGLSTPGGVLEKGPGKVGSRGRCKLRCESSEALPTPALPPCVSPELQHFYNNQSRLPDSRVVLCFGEEFPDMTPLRSKLILVQVRTGGLRAAARSPSSHLRTQFTLGLKNRQQGLGCSTWVQKQAWETFGWQQWMLATAEPSSQVPGLSQSGCLPCPFFVWLVFQNPNLLSRRIPPCLQA